MLETNTLEEWKDGQRQRKGLRKKNFTPKWALSKYLIFYIRKRKEKRGWRFAEGHTADLEQVLNQIPLLASVTGGFSEK